MGFGISTFTRNPALPAVKSAARWTGPTRDPIGWSIREVGPLQIQTPETGNFSRSLFLYAQRSLAATMLGVAGAAVIKMPFLNRRRIPDRKLVNVFDASPYCR